MDVVKALLELLVRVDEGGQPVIIRQSVTGILVLEEGVEPSCPVKGAGF